VDRVDKGDRAVPVAPAAAVAVVLRP